MKKGRHRQMRKDERKKIEQVVKYIYKKTAKKAFKEIES
jgi:hypothetical protein